MTFPKVSGNLPAGKWGQPGDEHWGTVDEAIGLIRQLCLVRRHRDLAHGEAEALLQAGIDAGLVQTWQLDIPSAYAPMRGHLQYFLPDLENLFEEVAATEEQASSPVAEQTLAEPAAATSALESTLPRTPWECLEQEFTPQLIEEGRATKRIIEVMAKRAKGLGMNVAEGTLKNRARVWIKNHRC